MSRRVHVRACVYVYGCVGVRASVCVRARMCTCMCVFASVCMYVAMYVRVSLSERGIKHHLEARIYIVYGWENSYVRGRRVSELWAS